MPPAHGGEAEDGAVRELADELAPLRPMLARVHRSANLDSGTAHRTDSGFDGGARSGEADAMERGGRNDV